MELIACTSEDRSHPSDATPAMPTKASHLVTLCDALETLMKLAGGYTMQAGFHVSPNGGMNAAGRFVSAISEALCSHYLDVIEAMRETKGDTRAIERLRQMRLACHDIDMDDDALDLVRKFTERN